jgi:2,3-dihydroxybenzoate-AMP ligase
MTPKNDPASLNGYIPFPDDRIASYRSSGYWRDLTFHDILDTHATETPTATAVIGPDRALTYDELAENSHRLATALRRRDIEPNERVVIQLPNSIEFLEAFFACSRIGTIPVMALPRHREAEVRHLLDHFDSTVYLTSADRDEMGFDFVSLLDDITDEYPHLETLITVTDEDEETPLGWLDFAELRSGAAADALDAVDVDPNEPGVMLLSGGTTGMPKGIPRTHNDYVFQWEYMADVAGIEDDWVAFPSVPIGHNASLNCIVGAALWTGATIAVEPQLKPEALMNLIEHEGGNYSLPIPAQLIDILEHPDLDEYDLSSQKVLVSGGQKVPPHVVRESADRWDVGFCNIFGMAEGPLICTRPDDNIEVQAETVGQPIAPKADEIRIVDRNRDEEVEQGTPGELSVRGPGFFTGYFRNDEENTENFDDDGWFYTEDVLARDEDGNYQAYGRIKDTIIRGGENIYAPAVEDVIAEHPKVANVALIGMPDERLGELPCAVVELVEDANSLTLDELTDFLEEEGVAVFKRPEHLTVMNALPRTGVGKIDKKQLTEQITE